MTNAEKNELLSKGIAELVAKVYPDKPVTPKEDVEGVLEDKLKVRGLLGLRDVVVEIFNETLVDCDLAPEGYFPIVREYSSGIANVPDGDYVSEEPRQDCRTGITFG